MTTFNNIVVLTGAGVSAESGLKTFRDNDGLWENHRIEDVCTPEAFQNNSELVQRFYNARRKQLIEEAKPNQAHFALAEFEQTFLLNKPEARFTLVTQNVDNLHEQAGSKNPLHMHGELLKARCTHSLRIMDWHEDILCDKPCPCCSHIGTLRPHIVWFGEMPLYMEKIELELSRCDLFVAIGTSGQVYPAAGFVRMARHCGAHTVEINLEPSQGQNQFAEHVYGPATQAVTQYFAQLVG